MGTLSSHARTPRPHGDGSAAGRADVDAGADRSPLRLELETLMGQEDKKADVL